MISARGFSRVARAIRCNKRTAAAGAGVHLNLGKLKSHRSVFSQHSAAATPIVLPHQYRCYSSQTETETCLDSVTYDRVCTETLDALSDYFEELTENDSNLSGTDVAYSDGVLTVNLGKAHGTYVINRQTPNKQIWLSSPTSGPKRYDFVGPSSGGRGKWIYKHSGESLHQLLQLEIPKIIKTHTVDFMRLPHCS